MYENIRRLYQMEKLNQAGIQKALAKGWLTADQAARILAEKWER